MKDLVLMEMYSTLQKLHYKGVIRLYYMVFNVEKLIEHRIRTNTQIDLKWQGIDVYELDGLLVEFDISTPTTGVMVYKDYTFIIKSIWCDSVEI